MAALQPVRGTYDILPGASAAHRWVGEVAREMAGRYGYGEIVTPIFEFTEVFSRTLGETSDVVTKEMYTFSDRGGESITLRPEGTAGVARAFISNGMQQSLPIKAYYQGPMFRYERPQKGRQRQFHQIGVELLGVDKPQADIEVITLGARVLQALGVADRVTLDINTLGDRESRDVYREKLVGYLSRFKGDLSQDSQDRLERNPMRILDSKDEGDKVIVADAPILTDSLNNTSRQFFDDVCAGLDTFGIAYNLNPKLVRGLDYYCHTAFEFVTQSLGAQGTVLAGGRYDGLIKQMGGPMTPGIGWAAGIERLAMMVDETSVPKIRPIAVIPAQAVAQPFAATMTEELRMQGFCADLGYSGNLGKRMKRANKLNARVAIIIGEDELSRQAATVRDLDTGDQQEVGLSEVSSFVARFY